jgi:hypothetical protein
LGNDQDEALSPRGLESYVPALCDLRAAYWPRLAGVLRHLLELGDYVGLERAAGMSVAEFHVIRDRIPGDLWRRCARVASPLESLDAHSDGALFRDGSGRPYSLEALISTLAQAMGQARV